MITVYGPNGKLSFEQGDNWETSQQGNLWILSSDDEAIAEFSSENWELVVKEPEAADEEGV